MKRINYMKKCFCHSSILISMFSVFIGQALLHSCDASINNVTDEKNQNEEKPNLESLIDSKGDSNRKTSPSKTTSGSGEGKLPSSNDGGDEDTIETDLKLSLIMPGDVSSTFTAVKEEYESLPDNCNSFNVSISIDPKSEETTAFQKILLNIGRNVAVPNICKLTKSYYELMMLYLMEHAFDNSFSELPGDALDTSDTPIKTQWKKVNSYWQFLESMKIGPLAADNYDLTYSIYSFRPSYCEAVENVLTGGALDLAQLPYKVKSLSILEYLIFNDRSYANCRRHAVVTDLMAELAWGDLNIDSKNSIQNDYAIPLMWELKNQIAMLYLSWSPNAGDYTSNTVFTEPDSNRKAINQYWKALYFIDEGVKDRKLGDTIIPDQYLLVCNRIRACLTMLENPHAKATLESIRANYLGALSVLDGTYYDPLVRVNTYDSKNLGIGAYMERSGGLQFSTKLRGTIVEALNIIDTHIYDKQSTLFDLLISGDYSKWGDTSADNRLYEPSALHKDAKKVSDTLKDEFVTTMQLSIPETASGDTD